MGSHLRVWLSIARGHWDAWRMSHAGATAIEYALIVGSVAVAIVMALNYLGVELSDLFDKLANALSPGPRCVEVGSNCDKSK